LHPFNHEGLLAEKTSGSPRKASSCLNFQTCPVASCRLVDSAYTQYSTFLVHCNKNIALHKKGIIALPGRQGNPGWAIGRSL